MLFSKKRRRTIILCSLGIAFFIFLFRIRIELKSILNPFILAILFAYLLNPLVNFVQNKKIFSRLFSVIIVYILLFSLMIIIGWSIIPALVVEMRKLIIELPNYTKQLQNIIFQFKESNLSRLPDAFSNIFDSNIIKIQEVVINSFTKIIEVIASFFSKIVNIVMIPVLTFYFLKDKDFFKAKLIYLIPKRWKSKILEVAKDSDRVIGRFLRGRIILCIYVGIFTALGLNILKINYAIVIGLVAGIFDIIPYFGPVIGAIPAIIIAFLQEPIKVIYVIVWLFIVQQIEGDIIAPKVIGSSVGLHPVTIILALLAGGTFFGIVGMILAVPFVAIIKVIGEHTIDYIASMDHYVE